MMPFQNIQRIQNSQKNPFIKWTKDRKRDDISVKENTEMAKKQCLKDVQYQQEMQIKPHTDYHTFRMTKIKIVRISNSGNDIKTLDHSSITGVK